jgi:hypothetical protein
MKKKYILIIVVIAVILLYPALRSPNKENISIMDVISSAPAVKLESAENEDAILIDNDLTPAHNFATLSIEPSEDSEGESESEWIYRFTYNPKEKVINGTEIVVLFGSGSLSINSELYKPLDGVNYEKILEWAENTYNYYSAE